MEKRSQRSDHPNRLGVHESLHGFPTDQRDVFSKAATVFLDQFAAVLILFSLHFLKDLSGRGVIGFQSRGEVCVDARVRFLGRNGQREDFLFRKVLKIFGHCVFSAYQLITRIPFLANTDRHLNRRKRRFCSTERFCQNEYSLPLASFCFVPIPAISCPSR
jgi:hypothetical protein